MAAVSRFYAEGGGACCFHGRPVHDGAGEPEPAHFLSLQLFKRLHSFDIMQEEAVVNAFTADLYVTTLGNLSLRGSVTSGFDGDHELLLGGYSQVR